MKALAAVAILAAVIATNDQEAPKVYLTWKSVGNTWSAMRDQSQEMAKDLAKDCPEVPAIHSRQNFSGPHNPTPNIAKAQVTIRGLKLGAARRLRNIYRITLPALLSRIVTLVE